MHAAVLFLCGFGCILLGSTAQTEITYWVMAAIFISGAFLTNAVNHVEKAIRANQTPPPTQPPAALPK